MAQVVVEEGPTGITVQVDAQGRYTLKDLKPGNYVITGFDGTGAEPIPRTITLAAGEHLESIDLRLLAVAKIRGKVVDQDNEPLAGIDVCLVPREYAGGKLRHVFAKFAQTDDQGRYEMDVALLDRSFLLYAWEIHRKRPAISDVAADPKRRRPVAVPTFYPNADRIEGAGVLTVKSGEVREGVDIRMLKGASYCMDGKIALSPLAEGTVEISSSQVTNGNISDRGGYMTPDTAAVAQDGRFRVCGFGPGEYSVRAVHLPKQRVLEGLAEGTSTVIIKDSDVHDVAPVLYPPTAIQGSVVWAGAAPKSSEEARLYVRMEMLSRGRYGQEELEARADVPGAFVIPAIVPSLSVVRLNNVPKTTYVKDITYGGASVRSRSFQPGTGVGNAELKVILDHDGGTVQLKVADKENHPVAGCNVMVFPQSFASEAEFAEQVITAATDQYGNYQSAMLAPGKYFVVASHRQFYPNPDDVTWLLQQRNHAYELTVEPGSQQQIALTLRSE